MLKKNIQLNDALIISSEINRRINFGNNTIFYETGSIFRRDPIVHDIDYILISDHPINNIHIKPRKAGDLINNIKIKVFGRHRISIYVFIGKYKIHVDWFLSTTKDYIYTKFQYDNTKLFNIKVRTKLKKHGLLINQFGIFKRDTMKQISNIKSEQDIIEYINNI